MFKEISTQQFFHSSKWLFGMSLFTAMSLQSVSSIAAQVAKLNNWRFYPEGGKLEINLSESKTPSYFYLSQPPRLVVDIPNTKLGNIPTEQSYTGVVQKIRVAQLNANVTRIVLDLAADVFVDPQQVQLQPNSRKNPTSWVLRPFISGSRQLVNSRNLPSNTPQTQYNYLQLPNTLPSTTANLQQPFVTVPPLNSQSPVQTPHTSQSASNLPTQPSYPANSPNFPTPTTPNSANNAPNFSNPIVIEFGQPLPKMQN
ncbi:MULTISPECIES: AMIN domain-containing protein [unclassified Anabaena]|uniref:AMIN domain-containing protein n=1 Tax=unclassified Anabaena TaxID=2619674 RepID=UPI00082B17DF|nr:MULTISPECIES: AMIN domain-containing protein [unclassified Anabaena]